MNYNNIIDELSRGKWQYLDSLLIMLKVEENKKIESFKK